MPREGTKAAEIMRLYAHEIFTIQEIAESVGCKPEYVRVVARQRKGSGMSANDRKYQQSDKGRVSHRQRGKAYYQRHRAKKLAYRDAKEAANA